MPKILHESTGLTIKINDINQFCIVTLHYTADPARRSEAWKKEAAAGMATARFEKEYEISYLALFGERVFPEITSHKYHITIGEPLEFPDTQVYWGGFDYGLKNPSCLTVYTIHDSITYCVWELYEPCKNLPDFVGKMKACPYWNQIRYIAADPSMFNKTQLGKNGINVSPASLFQAAGITKLIPGNNDEVSWLTMMREHWKNPEDPTFKIYSSCVNLIREYEGMVFASMSEKALATQNYREDLVDRNNHALDSNKYFLNSRPRQQRHLPLKPPTMYKRWLK